MDATTTPPDSPLLHHVQFQVPGTEALEEAAGFGRWWYEPATDCLLLSTAAAQGLKVQPGRVLPLDQACSQVLPDDLPALRDLLAHAAGRRLHCELRVNSASEGLRWLRLSSLPEAAAPPGIVGGILVDATAQRHAAMRERLGFALTEYLVGSRTLGDAVISVIQLVCRQLGWDWGAYWSLETARGDEGGEHLVCRHCWHPAEQEALRAFSRQCQDGSIRAGQGVVGAVWQDSVACWVEDVAQESRFIRRAGALAAGLVSGYVFPVTYVDAEGRSHRPGVLEFYSTLSRQNEAQLPNLAATIGALIAQTAQRLEHQATILHLAQVDGLTGLANRNHFYALLGEACERAGRERAKLGLMFIDLDRFKPINDAFGHEAGNVVLREFAARLLELAPSCARVGRLGGDEFALMVPGLSVEGLRALALEVLQAARSPFFHEGVELTVSASVGISTFPESGGTGPELLRSADAAMYRVKQNGRNDLEVSSVHALALQQSQLAERLAIETELHHALQGDELFLQYQPIVDMARGRIGSVEALLRWRRADGTVVPPDLFIPIAEQSHLIAQIGKWVVARVCADLAALDDPHFADLRVHVNMAASEFASPELPDELGRLVRGYGLEPRRISLELTEGMLMKRPDQVVPVMRALRALGFEISLDDFGMGHSSLALLKNLPITAMKIDRSFVRDLSQRGNDRAIVKTIVDLGRHMQLKVIAEGVETAAQREILQASGCTQLQGYLLSPPLPMAELLRRYPAALWQPVAPSDLLAG